MVVPTLFGLEGIVARELRFLDCEDVQAENGRVLFSGDWEDVARTNLNLRSGERVQILLARFYARTFDELFEGVRRIPLEAYIGRKEAFPVKGWSLNSQLHSVPDCQKIIKKAAVERLKTHYHVSWFEETGSTVQIQFSILKVCISGGTERIRTKLLSRKRWRRGFSAWQGYVRIRFSAIQCVVPGHF